MDLRLRSKPIRTVLRWQIGATVVVAVIAGWFAGIHGAISAVLGGAIAVVAGLAFAVLGSGSDARSSGEALLVLLRAEAVKVGLMVALLALVLALYRDAVVAGLIGSFILSVVIFTMAVFVREA